jgi:hypothetical protein
VKVADVERCCRCRQVRQFGQPHWLVASMYISLTGKYNFMLDTEISVQTGLLQLLLLPIIYGLKRQPYPY